VGFIAEFSHIPTFKVTQLEGLGKERGQALLVWVLGEVGCGW
jgi:hypothetical protein